MYLEQFNMDAQAWRNEIFSYASENMTTTLIFGSAKLVWVLVTGFIARKWGN